MPSSALGDERSAAEPRSRPHEAGVSLPRDGRHPGSWLEAPDHAEIWRLLAIAYEERGQPDRAREAAQAGVIAAPGGRDLHRLLERLESLGETLVAL